MLKLGLVHKPTNHGTGGGSRKAVRARDPSCCILSSRNGRLKQRTLEIVVDMNQNHGSKPVISPFWPWQARVRLDAALLGAQPTATCWVARSAADPR